LKKPFGATRVKRARRLLRAYTQDGSGHTINLRVYDRHLKDLNDQQLVFEQFKRVTSVQWARRSDVQSLEENYRAIETYLNELVKEYEIKRHLVKSCGDHGMPLTELNRLAGFYESHHFVNDKKGKPHDIGLEPNVSEQIDLILKQIQGALLAPLALPRAAYPH